MTASNGKWLEQKPQSGAEAVHGGSEKKSSPSHPQSKSSSAEPAREFNGVFSGVYDALLIGAGLSSIACASRLSQAGQRTLILEKSRGVGGRLATRRLALSVPSQGGAETSSVSESQGVLDSGAQKVEVSDERFLRALQAAGAQSAFSDLGLAKSGSWIHPRGMSQLAKQLVTQQHGGELVLQTQVTGLRGVNHSPQPYWQVECQGGAVYQASSLVISAPMPQAQALMQTIPGVQWGSQLEELWALPYDPCFALMLVLEGDPQSEALESGELLNPCPELRGIFNQRKKGIKGSVPAWVVQASSEWSQKHLEWPLDEVKNQLLALAAQWGLNSVQASHLHRWRYSEPRQRVVAPFFRVPQAPLPLFLIGDAFGQGGAQGAWISGWEAANELLKSAIAI